MSELDKEWFQIHVYLNYLNNLTYHFSQNVVLTTRPYFKICFIGLHQLPLLV